MRIKAARAADLQFNVRSGIRNNGVPRQLNIKHTKRVFGLQVARLPKRGRGPHALNWMSHPPLDGSFTLYRYHLII